MFICWFCHIQLNLDLLWQSNSSLSSASEEEYREFAQPKTPKV